MQRKENIPMDSYFPLDGEQVIEEVKRPPIIFLVFSLPLIPVVVIGFIIGIVSKPFTIGFDLGRRI